jgi:hypothetical protein
MEANAYVVTIYTHTKADPQYHSGLVWDAIVTAAESNDDIGFDVFVEEPRRWTLLTRKVGVSRPLYWLSRLIRRTIVKQY